jgi:hypothetical protein
MRTGAGVLGWLLPEADFEIRIGMQVMYLGGDPEIVVGDWENGTGKRKKYGRSLLWWLCSA